MFVFDTKLIEKNNLDFLMEDLIRSYLCFEIFNEIHHSTTFVKLMH